MQSHQPNPYDELHMIVKALDSRFPDGNTIFQRISHLTEETGELAQAVNHIEDMGIKREKYGEPNVKHLVKEIQDVIRAALGVALHYGVETELEQSIHEAYVRLAPGDIR